MGYIIQRQKKPPFCGECGQTWEPIAQKVVEVFILGDIQSLTRHNPEQPAPADLPCAKIRKYQKVNLTELLQCINV